MRCDGMVALHTEFIGNVQVSGSAGVEGGHSFSRCRFSGWDAARTGPNAGLLQVFRCRASIVDCTFLGLAHGCTERIGLRVRPAPCLSWALG
jgi:hypothetical protein